MFILGYDALSACVQRKYDGVVYFDCSRHSLKEVVRSGFLCYRNPYNKEFQIGIMIDDKPHKYTIIANSRFYVPLGDKDRVCKFGLE